MDTKTDKRKINRKVTQIKWNGIDKQGNKTNGTIKNISIEKARMQLMQRGIRNIKLKERSISSFNISFETINKEDIASVTRQLATMLKAGIPVVQAFEITERGIEKEILRELVASIKKDVKQGMSLTNALKQHPKYFDTLYCSLVNAGEKSGALDVLLDRIATFMEKNEDIKRKVKKAMYYPAAVIFISMIVTSILLLKVVPQFEDVFKSFGADLPAFTKVIISLSDFLQENFLKLIIAIAAGVYFFKRLLKTSDKLRFLVDSITLKIPVLGGVLKKSIIARFSRTLSTTFAAGVPLVKSLQFTAATTGNQIYTNGILKIKEQVETGIPFNVAMEKSNLFPVLAIQMISAGESSGMLSEMLEKFAAIYESEVDDVVGGLSSLIEPLVISILGILVGGLIVAMYLPIFQLGSLV